MVVSRNDPAGRSTDQVLKQRGQGFIPSLWGFLRLWACRWQCFYVCSFGAVGLFTNMPIDGTIQVCLDTLYRSDIKPPSISKSVLTKLLLKVWGGVQLTGNYRQKDGVATWSPLGPVLVNVFHAGILWKPHSGGSLAASLPEVCWWHICSFGLRWQCVDVFEMLEWVTSLIAVHDREWGWWEDVIYGCTSQEGGECVHDSNLSEADIHRFIHAARWDKYCSTIQKIALVRPLAQRARKIYSPQYLDGNMEMWQSTFEKNGYPDQLSAVLYSRFWKTSRCVLIKRKADKCTSTLIPWLSPKSAACS